MHADIPSNCCHKVTYTKVVCEVRPQKEKIPTARVIILQDYPPHPMLLEHSILVGIEIQWEVLETINQVENLVV